MELGAQKTFFPVVAHSPPDGLGQALLDSKGHARAIVGKLWVDARIVLGRRREARNTRTRRLQPSPGWVHNDGL